MKCSEVKFVMEISLIETRNGTNAYTAHFTFTALCCMLKITLVQCCVVTTHDALGDMGI